MNTLRARPNWVDEEPFVQALLSRFLDQLDRGVKPLFRINEKNTPELYNYQDEDPYYLWDLVKSLDKEYHALTVKKQRARSGRESFENAQLYFNPDKEALIREWLNRPAFDPYTLNWSETLEKIRDKFEDHGLALEQPLREPERSASEVLQGFAKLTEQLKHPQSLRNLSAKCFWGDSKFLDAKYELLQALYPEASRSIIIRPVLLNVHLPENFNEILFVENQDSFLMMSQLANRSDRFSRTAVVYSAGFKGSARNIRNRSSVVFSFVGRTSGEAVHEFEHWWFTKFSPDDNQAIHKEPAFFWGDLDFSGMAILASLKRAFPDIQAWKPGYEAMLVAHDAGAGHKQMQSKKYAQHDPGLTGCQYSDEILLPLMRESERFLDQEIIAASELGGV